MELRAKIGAISLSLLVLAVGSLELSHWLRFGHFAPFGLHADVVVRKADYGIEGITKVYEGRLTNYGFLPAKITVCNFVEDAMWVHGTEVGYTIEKWDPSDQKWKRLFTADASSFCHPYPLGMVKADITIRKLWPEQSIATAEEATAARDIFAIDDQARFVVFAGNNREFPTAAFTIDERPTNPNTRVRVQH